MHPAIATFPSKQFYQSELRTGIVGSQRPVPNGFAWPVPSAPVAFVPVEGEEPYWGAFLPPLKKTTETEVDVEIYD